MSHMHDPYVWDLLAGWMFMPALKSGMLLGDVHGLEPWFCALWDWQRGGWTRVTLIGKFPKGVKIRKIQYGGNEGAIS